MSNSPQNQDSLGDKLKTAFDSNNFDKNYNAVKALLSSIPTVGSLGVSLWESRTPSPAMQRLYIFLETLVREFEELKSKIELVDFESPAFQTTLIHVYQIVIRTHQEQKLEALRNIVLNSSIPNTLEDDVLVMFLNWIDGFTELHISTLKHLHYLDRYAPEELCTHFLMSDRNKLIYNKVLKDLADEGLISLTEKYITEEEEIDISLQTLGFPMAQASFGDSYNRGKKKSGKEIKMKTFVRREDIDTILKKNRSSSQASKTTELGKEFIQFIEYPSI
jgi:hypothetical protein